MITTLTATTTERIVSALVAEEGVSGGSHVLTLIIDTDTAGLEDALAAAHGASRDHPCRIIAVVRPDSEEGAVVGPRSRDGHVPSDLPGHLDAEIRVGHDAGAGETLVLRPWGEAAEHVDTLVVPLLLPDVPVVTWWPTAPPDRPSTDPLGKLASTRITNTPALPDPVAALKELAPSFTRGDIDLAWTRITLWRAMVASTLDPVLREGAARGIVVAGEPGNASIALMIRWLALRTGVAVEQIDVSGFSGIASITVNTPTGEIVIARMDQERATITRPGGEAPQVVTMPRREPITTMNEELRRLTPDLVFEEVLASFAAECCTSDAPDKARS
jgi:opcA family protein